MKQLIYLSVCICMFFAASLTAAAQSDNIPERKNEEIIIRKKGNKDSKMIIEMNGDSVTINGKPLSEFNNDEVTIMQRKNIRRGRNSMLMPPQAPGADNFFFNEDGPRPLLGVTTEKADKGARITNVTKNSAAEKAGLKEGDIITKIKDKKISDPQELMDAVRTYKPKEQIKIYYERNGRAADTKATLGEIKEIIKSFSFNRRMPEMNEDMMQNFKFEMPLMPDMPGHFFSGPNKKLGIKIEDTEEDKGVKISGVEPGSAAEKAGLKTDDIITEVNGEKVTNTDEAREKILDNEKPTYNIKAKRGSTEMNFDIKVPKKINSANL